MVHPWRSLSPTWVGRKVDEELFMQPLALGTAQDISQFSSAQLEEGGGGGKEAQNLKAEMSKGVKERLLGNQHPPVYRAGD